MGYKGYRTIAQRAGRNSLYYKRRRSYGKYAVAGAGALVTAKAAYHLAKKVKKMVNVEYKERNLSNWNLQIDNSPTVGAGITLVNGMATGDTGESDRDGQSVKNTRLSYKVTLKKGSVDVPVRVIFFSQHDTNNANVDITDFWNVSGNGDPENYFANLQKIGNFSILSDKVYRLSSDKPLIHDSHTVDLNSHTRYNGTTSAITSLSRGAIYYLVCTDITSPTAYASGAGTSPSVSTNIRLRYVDN